MSTDHRSTDEGKQPKAIYLGDGPWEGDADFKAWQRRGNAITWWDVLSVALPIAGLVGAGVIWSQTSSVALANVVFFGGLMVGSAMAIRKWWWAHTGS